VRRTLALGALLVVLAGVAGYVVGRHSGADLASARREGRSQGTAAGNRAGTLAGRQAGLPVGRRKTYHRAYRVAYRASYHHVLAAGKTTPKPAAQPAQPPAIDCPGVGDTNITGVSVRLMTCGQAQGIIDNFGPINVHFTVLGFTCDRLEGGDLGGTWRCVRGQQALRFGFGD